jgi:hypothetical protein
MLGYVDLNCVVGKNLKVPEDFGERKIERKNE